MRKIQFILSVVLSFVAFSCKDLTNLVPADSFSDATAFNTAQAVELSVIGMYDAAQSGYYAGGAIRGYPFGAASIEQGDMRGEDMLNQASFYQITYESSYTPFSANNDYMWRTLFSLINQANVTIEGVQGALANKVITDAAAAAYQGEARFMRALAYHELLIHFARPYADNKGANMGVPIRDFAVNSPATVDKAAKAGRNTVAECYAFMLADLDYAETNLPDTRSGNLKVVRPVKGAAIALKTRVKLHQGDWQGVITEGNKIVSTSAPFKSAISGFALAATPDVPFKNNYSTESVFSIENNAADNAGVNGALAAMLGNPAKGARGLVRISPIVFNMKEFLPTDLRRGLMENDGRSYYTNKYSDYANRTDAAPLIRYAEVLLNLSEAYARTGDAAKALIYLNGIRSRSVTDATKQYSSSTFADTKSLVGAILAERRIELLAEGRRWADIHRLSMDPDFSTSGIPAKIAFGNATFNTYTAGVPATALTLAIKAIPYTDYRYLWPIPAVETSTNPTLAAQQNPGY